MRISLNRNSSSSHKWFAWFPVVAEKSTPSGVAYEIVWLESVDKTLIRVQGIIQWKYVIK